MGIKFKIDEDLPQDIAERLLQSGFDAQTVLQQGWSGVSDQELWTSIQTENRTLIAADKGFADIRIHPPGIHAGVILFRLEPESRSGYLALLENLLKHEDLNHLGGAVVVVSPRGVRIYHP